MNPTTIPHTYSAENHTVWRHLYRQQCELLKGRVCDEFMDGLSDLAMGADAVPNFEELNQRLQPRTGWQVIAVDGLVDDAVFFEHLANRRFPATWWMRDASQLDYLQEPDCFHDVFGHVPLLVNPVFADYMQAYGQGGVRAASLNVLPLLSRLYWYTVEFGLLQTAQGLRIYGAGIVSSKTESVYALESPIPHRLAFEPKRVMRTHYKIDDVQAMYFVIRDFEQLFAETQQDFAAIYTQVQQLSELMPAELLAGESAQLQEPA